MTAFPNHPGSKCDSPSAEAANLIGDDVATLRARCLELVTLWTIEKEQKLF